MDLNGIFNENGLNNNLTPCPDCGCIGLHYCTGKKPDGFKSSACEKCGNNPKNGDDGICSCTLGTIKIN